MTQGFPLLTTKKIAYKSMITELRWMLKGDTNIKYLLENNCHIWTGDCYSVYERTHQWELDNDYLNANDEFAEKWGELGPIYGKQWRDWSVRNDGSYDGSIDQISNLIHELKTNPNSRRLMVSAWNVSEIDKVVLPPCHYGFQCYVSDGKLSLMWNQRSADLFLGVPFNISSYGLLLMLLCEETGYEPGELIGNFGDTHLYLNHTEQAKEQISRDGFELPTIKLSNVDVLEGNFDVELTNYKYHPTIKAPISN